MNFGYAKVNNAQKNGAGRTCPTRRTLEYRRVTHPSMCKDDAKSANARLINDLA